MADIELVIKIPEVIMKYIKRNGCLGVYNPECEDAIINGTPRPKGYDRLIDAKPILDKLMQSYNASAKDYPEQGKDYRVGLSNAIELLNNAPTIIEKDVNGIHLDSNSGNCLHRNMV